MALRLKTEWFKAESPRSAADRAGAMAAVVWRLAQEMLKRMRKADFDIDVGPRYFDFLREAAVFLALVADRIAHARLDAERRGEFVAAMVLRLADLFDESAQEWLGPAVDGPLTWRETLIDAFNEQAPCYGEFSFDPEGDGTDFGFVRYFGSRLEPLLPEKDRRWAIEQVMSAEAPDAVILLRQAMTGVFSTTPRRERRAAATRGE